MMHENLKIKMVGINPTYKCNLNCFMCGQRKMDQADIARELDLEKIKETVLECKKYGLQYGVYLWGGEPLLYSKIGQLLEFLGEQRIFTTINTNGVFLNKYTQLIIDKKILCRLIISIDGTEAVHDKIRGVKGTYNKIKNNIEQIKAYRKKNLILSTNTVVTSENYNKLFDVISDISELGVDLMECQLPIYFSDECGQRYEDKMLNCLNTEAVRWRGFRGNYSEINVEKLIKQIELIKNKFGKKFRLAPYINSEQIRMYFTNPDQIHPVKVCALPFSQVHVEPNGDVIICPDFPDYVVGNIYESNLEEILFSDRNVAFKEMISKEKLSICSRCCQYYQF